MSRRLISSLILAVGVLVLAAVPAGAAVSAGNTGWRWSNPQPQGNTLATVDFAGGRGYAAGKAGTLLRSDDLGAIWSSSRSGLATDITLLKAVSADSFVFTTGCALRRSDDGGATVQRLPWTSNDFVCVNRIRSFAFPTVDTGYLLLDNGSVYVTADRGQSWALATALPGTPSGGGAAEPGDIHFTSATAGVATAGNAIYRTTNGGSSWTLANNVANGFLRRFAFSSALDGIVVGDNSTPLVTADGGATFTPVATAPGAQLHDVDCATALLCVARNSDGQTLRRTDDGGTTWAAIAPSSQGIYGVSFASPTRAVGVGNAGATVASSDAGVNWAAISSSIDGVFSELRVRSGNVAYVFGEGGALGRTTDAGATWTRFNVLTSGNVEDAAFPEVAEGFVIDSNGQLLRTKNGGTSWQVLDTGTTARPRALFAPTKQTVALIGPKGIRRSDDGGANFSLLTNKRLKRASLGRVDEAGSAVFAYGSSSIYRSDSKASTWKPVKGPRGRKIWVLDFSTAKIGHVLDHKGELWVTTNGGKRWKMLTGFGHNDNSNGSLTTMAWGDAKNGFVSGPDQPILNTNDGGKTWTEQTAFARDGWSGSVLLGASGANNAFALRSGTSSIIVTGSGGRFGTPSTLKLKPTKTKVRRNTNLKVGGTLAGATGGEQVTIAARPVGAKPGTEWKYQDVIVSSTGTFTSVWKIKRAMVFVGWWDGDAARDGDGATPVTVKLK